MPRTYPASDVLVGCVSKPVGQIRQGTVEPCVPLVVESRHPQRNQLLYAIPSPAHPPPSFHPPIDDDIHPFLHRSAANRLPCRSPCCIVRNLCRVCGKKPGKLAECGVRILHAHLRDGGDCECLLLDCMSPDPHGRFAFIPAHRCVGGQPIHQRIGLLSFSCSPTDFETHPGLGAFAFPGVVCYRSQRLVRV